MKCATCSDNTIGKSKYCRRHRAEARARWKQKVGQDQADRNARYVVFQEAIETARQRGELAARNVIPVPMVVQQHANALDDASPVVKSWHVSEGVCGFAWVRVRPGGSSFARWAIKRDLATKAYRGGITLRMSFRGQSYARAMAYARAAAESLQQDLVDYNLDIYSEGRID